jgi:hypothetical protein
LTSRGGDIYVALPHFIPRRSWDDEGYSGVTRCQMQGVKNAKKTKKDKTTRCEVMTLGGSVQMHYFGGPLIEWLKQTCMWGGMRNSNSKLLHCAARRKTTQHREETHEVEWYKCSYFKLEPSVRFLRLRCGGTLLCLLLPFCKLQRRQELFLKMLKRFLQTSLFPLKLKLNLLPNPMPMPILAIILVLPLVRINPAPPL